MVDDRCSIGWSIELHISQSILVCLYHSTNTKTVRILGVTIQRKLMRNLSINQNHDKKYGRNYVFMYRSSYFPTKS